jgi:hypothetical protein
MGDELLLDNGNPRKKARVIVEQQCVDSGTTGKHSGDRLSTTSQPIHTHEPSYRGRTGLEGSEMIGGTFVGGQGTMGNETIARRTRSRDQGDMGQHGGYQGSEGSGSYSLSNTSNRSNRSSNRGTLRLIPSESVGRSDEDGFDWPILAAVRVSTKQFYNTCATGLCTYVAAYQAHQYCKEGKLIAIPRITSEIQEAIVKLLDTHVLKQQDVQYGRFLQEGWERFKTRPQDGLDVASYAVNDSLIKLCQSMKIDVNLWIVQDDRDQWATLSDSVRGGEITDIPFNLQTSNIASITCCGDTRVAQIVQTKTHYYLARPIEDSDVTTAETELYGVIAQLQSRREQTQRKQHIEESTPRDASNSMGSRISGSISSNSSISSSSHSSSSSSSSSSISNSPVISRPNSARATASTSCRDSESQVISRVHSVGTSASATSGDSKKSSESPRSSGSSGDRTGSTTNKVTSDLERMVSTDTNPASREEGILTPRCAIRDGDSKIDSSGDDTHYSSMGIVEVRQSDVHGVGVFMLQSLKNGQRVCPYKAKRISARQAQASRSRYIVKAIDKHGKEIFFDGGRQRDPGSLLPTTTTHGSVGSAMNTGGINGIPVDAMIYIIDDDTLGIYRVDR